MFDDDYGIHTQDEHYPVLVGDHENNNLRIELVINGLSFPTNMAFINNHDILVLEKNTGTVRLISDGVLRQKPLLRLNVDGKDQRGLLGLAILNNTSAVIGVKEDNKNMKNELQPSLSSLSSSSLFFCLSTSIRISLLY